MIKLYFERTNNDLILISDKIVNMEDVWEEINDFLEDKNFKSYYKRMWQEDGYKKVDVGSYTEFFRIYE